MAQEPKLRRFQVSTGDETRTAVVAVSSHAPIGRGSTRLVPRTEGQIRSRAQALGRDYFGVKWSVIVRPLDEPED